MMRYSIYIWNLVHALASAPPVSYKTLATFIVSICPNKFSEKAKNPETSFNSQQIVSCCLGLHTQNPELREVDWGPRPKRGSDMINMLK